MRPKLYAFALFVNSCALLLLLLLPSPLQAQSAADAAPPRNEFFAGYSFNSADIDSLTVAPERTGQHGLNLAYTRYVTEHVGLTFDASAHLKRDDFTFNNLNFERKRDQYHFLGGVQFKSRRAQSRVAPFAHVLAGGALFRGFAVSRTQAGNTFLIDDAESFAMAFGGGLDVRAGKHFDIRVFQADYLPTFFGSTRQDNLRLSFGVVFRK
ncbi:MAG TPA: hypothetical protein VK363_04395 [Pyrinomonadaceae bacterium]|nr:hypothetical protein [Pyrinomonadaceae bacterium]